MKLIFTWAFLIIGIICQAETEPIRFTGGSQIIGKNLEIFEDTSGKLTIKEIREQNNFIKNNEDAANMGQSESAYWIRFTIDNLTPNSDLFLELAYPLIHRCELYYFAGKAAIAHKYSEYDTFDSRDVKHQNLIFHLTVQPNAQREYYLKITGESQVILPLIIHDQKHLFESSLFAETINGIYAGIILVMILYNLFIYFSTREKSYLYYVLYILFIGLAQTTLSGYAYKYLWPSYPGFNSNAVIWFSVISGVFAVFFFKNFLQVKEKLPIGILLLNIMLTLYVLTGLLNVFGYKALSFRGVDISGGYAALATTFVAIKIAMQDYRPAKFFLAAWSIFLLGLILLVLRNINILPYNMFTTYTMQTGTIFEVILLSFALADKINILKKEREASQERALLISKENERIIKEQNISLEGKVLQRTKELSKTNEELQNTLNQLKDAQSQIIESEKMASLGQLTAGIAHEINNPINFVSSNVRPLRRDIDDILEMLDAYGGLEEFESQDIFNNKVAQIRRLKKDLDIDYLKSELDMLLTGMEDGAKRTVEIVKGLKIFSRVDEYDLNLVDINEGMESTLVILNYQIGSEITLEKDLGEISKVECYGGKINQCFMNILSNSIYALKNDPDPAKKPLLSVKTWQVDEDHVAISLKDNGTGIPPEVKSKIFDPFFTTKQIGEGTGLGLSIVFKIIEVHNGTLQVNSEVGEGTEFLITLPVLKKKNTNLHNNE
ncbi:sensor histidine kinase [Dyadobacter tibetensis]|uniref:sensor histidine kinase n=1 Tax=Dyadobacter tibetensis TaxID=1211851 RepID=UPI0004705C06|nr:7TM diverse intracellular signaling domain-containing protein [Dyadobacter tibetensis]